MSYEFKDFFIDAREAEGEKPEHAVLVARFVDGNKKFLPAISIPKTTNLSEFPGKLRELAAQIELAAEKFTKRGK